LSDFFFSMAFKSRDSIRHQVRENRPKVTLEAVLVADARPALSASTLVFGF
jgi:hypothetical protein